MRWLLILVLLSVAVCDDWDYSTNGLNWNLGVCMTVRFSLSSMTRASNRVLSTL